MKLFVGARVGTSMLLHLIDTTLAAIESIDPVAASIPTSTLLMQAPASRLVTLQQQGASPQQLFSEAIANSLLPLAFTRGMIPRVRALRDALVSGQAWGRQIDACARLSIAAILNHLVCPSGPLRHDLPGGYGYLDDWLYVTSALYEHLGYRPSNEERAQVRTDSETIVGLLPTPIAAGIHGVIGATSQEVAALRAQIGYNTAPIEALIADLVASPRPQPVCGLIVVQGQSQTQSQGAVGGRPGESWSFSPNGSSTVSFAGGHRTRFSDGSSIAMVGDKIVGLGR